MERQARGVHGIGASAGRGEAGRARPRDSRAAGPGPIGRRARAADGGVRRGTGLPFSAIWLDTSRSTRLYAVQGRLVNDGPRPVLAGRGTQVALLSTGGERLAFPASQAGLPLAEPLLRELSPHALAGAAAASAAQLARTRLWPGQAVDFQAFFDDVPDEATSFLLERTEASGRR